MARWQDVERDAPDLAQKVRRRFAVRKHATLATVRSDGGPRISGIEVEFTDNDVYLGSMPGAVKALDLRRDPRFALHSPTVDPPAADPGAWEGEAKIAGVVEEVTDASSEADGHRFRLHIRELVYTRVTQDRLEITSWHEGRGVTVRTRD
ncbi:MAG TPA: pyridoxamine 5'-phosphate oxidase family protein [Mycobacteriales bacterium]|jgi:hypothetical protein|nr:pyridoxamine 5'-phosphate oxidase family protein [Mycobacteriales bacterium]